MKVDEVEFMQQLLEVFGRDTLLNARLDCLSNLKTTEVETAVGRLIGGRVTMKITFDPQDFK